MHKSKKNAPTKTSVADRILWRLQGFKNALESKEPIGNRFTCHKFALDLRSEPYTAAMVKNTRRLLGASQQIFAQLLGVSLGTVRAWEQGENPPQPIACRFMDEIRRNPRYWVDRLKAYAVAK